jgi:hypothetical protein
MLPSKLLDTEEAFGWPSPGLPGAFSLVGAGAPLVDKHVLWPVNGLVPLYALLLFPPGLRSLLLLKAK